MIKVSKKHTYNGVDFDVQNVLKLTYQHLYFQIFFQRRYPRIPLNEGGKELREEAGMERQGKEGKGGSGMVGEKGGEGEERG